jgi:iron complex outermembrane receptor protein
MRLRTWVPLLAVLPAPTFAQEVLLPEMTVSAAPDPLELRRHASAATIVFGREDIEAMDAASVGELLRKLPGTSLIPDMEGKRGRGKGADKMMPLILVDGEPLPGGERNPATALRMAPELIERVEIIRNGGAEYPSAGPGGIINLVLRDVPPQPTLNLRAGLGTQGDAATARFEGQVGQRDGDFGWLLSGSAHRRPLDGRRETEIQRFAAGTRTAWTLERAQESGREHGATFAPRFTWRLPGGAQFILSPFLATNEERRAATTRKLAYADPVAAAGLAATGTDVDREHGHRDSARLVAEWRAMGRAAQPWSELSWRLLLQGEEESKRKDSRAVDAAGALTGTRMERETRAEKEVGVTFKGKRLLAESHLLGLGAEWRGKHGDDRRAVEVDGLAQPDGADAATRQSERRAVLWAQDEWQLGEAHLVTPGLRLQAQTSRVTDGLGATLERSTRFAAPSLHYLWQPDPAWNLRASLARQEKTPGLKEFSGVVHAASGINSSGNPDKAGNPALAPETSLNLEAGVEHFLPDRAGTIGFSLFRREADKHIQKLVRLEGARWVERPFNVGTAVLTGGTLDFKARLDVLDLPQLTLRGNVARVSTRIVDPVANLGAGEGPRSSVNLGFDYEIGERRLTLGGNFNATSSIDRESSASVRQTQGARKQFDLYARQKLDRHLALRFSISNIGHPDRRGAVEELDAIGQLARRERDSETSTTLAILTLEGRW